jgi:DNA-binding MarR family transcriptional regulator
MAYQKSIGFSGPQAWILLMLSRKAPEVGLTQSELTRVMQVDASAITRMVKSMEEKGWIRRASDPQDNRLTRVFLTPAGHDVIRDLPQRAHDLQQRIIDSISPEQLNQLRCILTILDGAAREEQEINEREADTETEASKPEAVAHF